MTNGPCLSRTARAERLPFQGRPALVEFDYQLGGTLAYLAAWDVHHAKLFDRVEAAQPDGALLLDRAAQGAQPDDFASLDELTARLLDFGDHYRQIARAFE